MSPSIFFQMSMIIGISLSTNNFPIPSDTELAALRLELAHAFDTVSPHAEGETPQSLLFKPLAGSVLRLIFHDCGGPSEGNPINGVISKCDGCIELDDFKGHQNLEMRAIEPLEDIYIGSINNWFEKMSRADFWVFAATEAIRHTRKFAIDFASLPNIPNYFGREDCSSSPDLDSTKTQHKQFPSGIFGWTETFNWMNNNFGVNASEIVALLGAHTIGRLHADDSGFTGPWVPTWGSFDNSYYKTIVSGFLGHIGQRTAPNGLKEWARNDITTAIIPGFFTFLNVDIGLYKDLDNHSNDGTVPCGDQDYSSCPVNQETAPIVERFAKSTQDWLDVFVPAYIKMTTAGYDIKTELIDQASISKSK